MPVTPLPPLSECPWCRRPWETTFPPRQDLLRPDISPAGLSECPWCQRPGATFPPRPDLLRPYIRRAPLPECPWCQSPRQDLLRPDIRLAPSGPSTGLHAEYVPQAQQHNPKFLADPLEPFLNAPDFGFCQLSHRFEAFSRKKFSAIAEAERTLKARVGNTVESSNDTFFSLSPHQAVRYVDFRESALNNLWDSIEQCWNAVREAQPWSLELTDSYTRLLKYTYELMNVVLKERDVIARNRERLAQRMLEYPDPEPVGQAYLASLAKNLADLDDSGLNDDDSDNSDSDDSDLDNSDLDGSNLDNGDLNDGSDLMTAIWRMSVANGTDRLLRLPCMKGKMEDADTRSMKNSPLSGTGSVGSYYKLFST